MILHYKDYEGSIEYDCEDGVYHGEVLNTPHLITYSHITWEGLVKNFMEAVDEDIEDEENEPNLVRVNIPLDVVERRLRKK